MDFISVIPTVLERNLRGGLIYSVDAQAHQLINELLQAMQNPRDDAEALWSRANSYVLVSRETLDQLGVLQSIDREVLGVSLPHPGRSTETTSQQSAAQIAGLEQELKAMIEATGIMARGSVGARELARDMGERLAAWLPMVLEVEKAAHPLLPRSDDPDVSARPGALAKGMPAHAADSLFRRESPVSASAAPQGDRDQREDKPPGQRTYEMMQRTAALIDSMAAKREGQARAVRVSVERGNLPEAETPGQHTYLMLQRVAAIIDGAAARQGASWQAGATHEDPFELLDAKAFAERMDATDQTVYNAEKAGRLISVLPPGRQRHRRYPAFQLSARLDKPLHEKAIAMYREHGHDMTLYWDFLRTRHKDFGGSTGVDFLLKRAGNPAFADLSEEDQHAIFLSLAEEDMSRTIS